MTDTAAIDDTIDTVDLFGVGVEAFETFRRAFAEHDVHFDPTLRIEKGRGVLCYYKRDEQVIYLSVPSPGEPEEPIYRLVMGSMLSAESDEEFDRFLRLFVPRVVAHELGHALRDQHDRFGDNLWEEEQVANQLAVALQNRFLPPAEREFFQQFVARALDGIVPRVGSIDRARNSYLDQLGAMYAAGEIGTITMDALETVGHSLEVDPSHLMSAGPVLSQRAREGLQERDEIIQLFNEQGMDDQLHYFYFQLGWLQIDLAGRHTRYVGEFIEKRLGVEPTLLPPPADEPTATRKGVEACHRAYRQCLHRDETAARWFYKRYRAQLIRLLQATPSGPDLDRTTLQDASTFLLEVWEDGRRDRLDLLTAVVPRNLRGLLPAAMAELTEGQGPNPGRALPTEVDRVLWRRVVHGIPSPAATATLHRLALLDGANVFRTLPARVMLDLVSRFVSVHLEPGRPIIWQGDHQTDVFFLYEGSLEWVARTEGGERRGRIGAGQVVGEMAFLTEEPRTATVRATTRSRLFAIKSADLALLASRHPSIMRHIAGALARRLAETTKQ